MVLWPTGCPAAFGSLLTLQVRLHSVVQTATAAGSSPRKTAANKWPGGNRQHRDLSLAVVLERAHARLRVSRVGKRAWTILMLMLHMPLVIRGCRAPWCSTLKSK